MKGKARCRLHGGKTPHGAAHGRYRTGLHTKQALAENQRVRALLKRMRAFMRDL